MEISQYSSIVVSNYTHQVVSMLPADPLLFRVFLKNNPLVEDWTVYEHIAGGVHVQLFYDVVLQTWELATQRSVGGYHGLVGSAGGTPLRQRFVAALAGAPAAGLNAAVGTAPFDKTVSYHFVLQPASAGLDRVYLLGGFKNQSYMRHFLTLDWVRALVQCPSVHIHTPNVVRIATVQELFRKYGSYYSAADVSAVDIYSPHGETTIVYNSNYKRKREGRLLNPVYFFHFLCFRRLGRLDEFAANIEPVCKYEDHLQKYIQGVYDGWKDQAAASASPDMAAIIQQLAAQHPVAERSLVETFVDNQSPVDLFQQICDAATTTERI